MLKCALRRIWLLSVFGLLLGCGGSSGPKVYPAGGIVNYKGKPIAKINVLLSPTSSNGMVAEGTTDETGKFILMTYKPGDGAMAGDYNVSFNYVPDEVPVMPGMEGSKKVVSPIPEKYGDPKKSGHTATVTTDKTKNNFTFDLK